MAYIDDLIELEKKKKILINEYVKNSPAMSGKTTTVPYGYGPNSKPHPNVLQQFASYNCLFTLSGLSNDEITYSDRITSTPPHHIIALSGGIGAQNNWTPTTDENAT